MIRMIKPRNMHTPPITIPIIAPFGRLCLLSGLTIWLVDVGLLVVVDVIVDVVMLVVFSAISIAELKTSIADS